MRAGKVYFKNVPAGELIETDRRSYVFQYDDAYFNDSSKEALSPTLPKTRQRYESDHLFPFFFNMLPEGANKQVQCAQLKIDEKDYFGLLLAVAGGDTIGAVRVQPKE